MYVEIDLKTDDVNDVPNFAPISDAMRRPDVTALHIRSMYVLNAEPPMSLRLEAGTSPLVALQLTDAGSAAAELAHILSWPRQLRLLEISCERQRSSWPRAPFCVSGLLTALSPLKSHLEHFYYSASYMGDGPHDQDVLADFRSFTSLRTLEVPLDLLWQDTEEARDDGFYEVKLQSLDQLLPSSLRDLVLNDSYPHNDFKWCKWPDSDDEPPVESPNARRLFDWLMAIHAAKKASPSVLPALRSIHLDSLNHRPVEDGPPGTYSPLDCEHVRATKEALLSCGVTLTWAYNTDFPDIKKYAELHESETQS